MYHKKRWRHDEEAQPKRCHDKLNPDLQTECISFQITKKWQQIPLSAQQQTTGLLEVPSKKLCLSSKFEQRQRQKSTKAQFVCSPKHRPRSNCSRIKRGTSTIAEASPPTAPISEDLRKGQIFRKTTSWFSSNPTTQQLFLEWCPGQKIQRIYSASNVGRNVQIPHKGNQATIVQYRTP